MIALNDQINAARDVTKTHTSSVETFKSAISDCSGWSIRIELSSSRGRRFGVSTFHSRQTRHRPSRSSQCMVGRMAGS